MECFHSKPRSGHISIMFVCLFLGQVRKWNRLSHSGRSYCQLGLIPHEKPLSDFSVVKLEARSSLYLEMKHQPKANPGPQACSVHLHYHLLWLLSLQTCNNYIPVLHSQIPYSEKQGWAGLQTNDLSALWFTRSAWRIRWLHFVCSSHVSLYKQDLWERIKWVISVMCLYWKPKFWSCFHMSVVTLAAILA